MKDFIILVSHDIYNANIEWFKSNGLSEFKWISIDFLKKPDNYFELLKNAVCIISRDDVTEEEYLLASDLKLLQTPIAGYENISLERAASHGVYVCNNGGANSISVSEHVFLLILSLFRQFPYHYNSLKTGKWKNRKYSNIEMCGKSIGIIGLGNCGKELAKRAQSFDMEVFYYDIRPELETYAKPLGIQFLPFDEIMRTCDIVSFHVPLTKHTNKMANMDTLSLMKPEAVIINTSRGGVVCEESLFKILKEKRIFGAALDVFEKEPLDENSPLLGLDNLILTPHCAPSYESVLKARKIMLANIIKIYKNLTPDFTVINYNNY